MGATAAVLNGGSSSRLPVRLLVPDATKTKLVIDPQGLATLRSLGTKPVAVVTLIGRARSGKSFSLNTLLGVDHATGFEVGHTDRPKTVGASLWPRLIDGVGPDCTGNFSYVLIDTEGIGAGIHTYDKALLMVATLLSSRMVYHLDGWVYTDDVTKLYSVANLALHFERRKKLGASRLRGSGGGGLLPPVSWVVQRYRFDRDSDMPNATNLDVLYDVWLRELENPEEDIHVARYNATVRAAKELFPSHSVHLIPSAESGGDCVPPTLTPPMTAGGGGGEGADEEENPKRLLTDLAVNELAPGYNRAMDKLRTELFGCATTVPRRLTGGAMTGQDLAELLTEIIQPANQGVDYIGDKVMDLVARSNVNECATELATNASLITLPLAEPELELRLQGLMRQAEDDLVRRMSGEDESGSGGAATAVLMVLRPHMDELHQRFASVKTATIARNAQTSETLCSQIMERVIDELADPASIKNYGGELTLFDVAFESAVERYDRAARGPRADMYRRVLYQRSAGVRHIVIAEGAPRRRVTWLLWSIVAAFVAHTLANIVSGVRSLRFIGTIAALVQLAASALAIVAIWSVLGSPPVTLETVIDFLQVFRPILVGLVTVVQYKLEANPTAIWRVASVFATATMTILITIWYCRRPYPAAAAAAAAAAPTPVAADDEGEEREEDEITTTTTTTQPPQTPGNGEENSDDEMPMIYAHTLTPSPQPVPSKQ